jgi:YfiH family protein
MIIRAENSLSISFGEAQEGFYLEHKPSYQKKSLDELSKIAPFNLFYDQLKLNALIALDQVHKAEGLVITSSDQLEAIKPFCYHGDFCITNFTQIGLAIASADCLPIIFYDRYRHAIGAVHAGWRGSVAQVAINALKAMQNHFDTQADQLEVFFGPSAGPCCYSVGEDVSNIVSLFEYGERALDRRAKGLFFDLATFNKLQLMAAGVLESAISTAYNQCTICNDRFFSSRREKEPARRQLTVVTLNAGISA